MLGTFGGPGNYNPALRSRAFHDCDSSVSDGYAAWTAHGGWSHFAELPPALWNQKDLDVAFQDQRRPKQLDLGWVLGWNLGWTLVQQL